MKFRTELRVEKAPFVLDPRRPAVLLGSCFSDNIVDKMRSALWDAANPLGTLYNPLSIAAALQLALFREDADDEFRVSLKGMEPFFSWYFDSRMSGYSKEECEQHFVEIKKQMRDMIARAEVLCITFGTAWVYALAETPDVIVGNCHKQPSSMFIRRRLTVEEITECWHDMLSMLKEKYPNLKVVFTVSPVRHLKDGFTGNACSKAILRLAVEELTCDNPDTFYFPAYEIINDDLRDYRFYAADLVHPSDEAVEYVWEHFRSTFLDHDGEERLKEGERLRRAFAHRPLVANNEHEAIRRKSLRLQASEFQAKNPGMIIPSFPD